MPIANPQLKERKLIKAAHYFSDCSMSNFWSTFRQDQVIDDFKRIFDDGFNHIIIVVPWAQFQTTLDATTLCPTMSARLLYLFSCAKECRLKVILRIGYLWENAPVRQRTFTRYCHLPTSKKHKKGWGTYCSLLSELAQNQDNFSFAFTSWEDYFWPMFRRVTDLEPRARTEELNKIGFGRYLLETGGHNSTLEILRDEDFEVWKFARYFDTHLLDEFHNIAEKNFNGLEYEGRPDVNPFLTKYGIRSFVWTLTRLPYSRPITYFHPNIYAGRQQIISKEKALCRLALLLSQYESINNVGSKVFIDQFNFVTQNPEFSHFNSIDNDQLCEFVVECGNLLKEKSSGFGVWGYRDWTNDKIFNGAFALGDSGWQHQGAEFLKEHSCYLQADDFIEQNIFQTLGRDAIVYVEYECEKSATIEFIADGEVRGRLECFNTKTCAEVRLEVPVSKSIQIKCLDGSLELFRVALFDHVFSSGLYHRDLSERPTVKAIRELNSSL